MRPDYSELNTQQYKVYFLASGGRDSTAMILEAHKVGVVGTMVLGDTGFNSSKAIKVLERLSDLTGFSLLRVKNTWSERKPIEILRESFRAIPEALELAKKRKSYKRVFRCCDELKKEPMKAFFKKLESDSVLVLGIKGGDLALHRRYRMRELRDRGTFYRLNKKTGLLYYYPLRDCEESDIDAVLEEFGFRDIASSGCQLCPISCVADWQKKDPVVWLRSVRYARHLGIDFPEGNQTELMDFCTDS